MITQELLKQYFSYKDGQLVRNFNSGGKKAGTSAGWVNTVSREKIH